MSDNLTVDQLFKLADETQLRDDRIMPAERVYAKSGKTVSLNEAISLLEKRRRDPSLRIKGGVDDVSDSVRKQTLRKDAQTAGGAVKEAPEAAQNHEEPDTPEDSAQQLAEQQKPRRARATTAEIMDGVERLHLQVERLQRTVKSVSDKIKHPAAQENTDEKAPKSDTLAAFKGSNHRVTFIVQGMEFTVKCLNMIKDSEAHSLILAFSDDVDSFFTPPVQSTLRIRYDGNDEPYDLFYFGMRFSLHNLGLRFLGFLFDDSGSSEHQR